MKKIFLTLIIIISDIILAQIPIQEFNFNGTLHNTKNTISFTGAENYVPDRMGNEKSAQRLTNKALEAVIDNLPQKYASRTITIWVKMNDISTPNYIWGYGSAYNAQYFGLLQQGTTTSNSDLSLAGWGSSNDLIVNVPLIKNIWYQYSITFDGTISKIYRNGELLKYIKGMSRDTKGTIFRLGEINTTIGVNADIDDLKIYNVALSDKEIYDLYESSKQPATTLASNTKEIVVNKENEKIHSDLATPIIKPTVLSSKKIEIFSQGQKILSNNVQDINLNQLPEGTYLLKVSNLPSKKVTSK
ncbi:LamG domain-containing protein [Flavobacterium fluviatile]|uniref:LamG domain-containing protein n=1 Tax=Flavobacterium fluviatile TaxID=1862387 RepID=UPI0013D0EB25|nr:LamG domain-containing protein [Flavobacterium fluviatile]